MLNTANPPDKITIIRLSAIGDVLMLLPAVRLLKKQFPETPIDWLIDRPIASLLAELTEVNVVPIDKPKSISAYWQFRQQWHHANIGQLLSFQTSLVSNLVMALLPAEHKTGFGAPYTREGHQLFTNTAYDLPSHLHQVDIFFALAQKFAGIDAPLTITAADLMLPISHRDTVWASEQLQTRPQWIAINPMASTQEKTWSQQHYIELIKQLQQQYPEQQIVLTGGSSAAEVKFGQQIQQQIHAPCLNLIGKTSLTQLAAILKQANLVISPDTGPLHLANAVATPVIGLYAVTRPEYIGPYLQLENCINIYPQTAEEVIGRPATELAWQKKIPSLTAMKNITVAQVLAKVGTLKI